jgi:type VI protein secretion system component VasF
MNWYAFWKGLAWGTVLALLVALSFLFAPQEHAEPKTIGDCQFWERLVVDDVKFRDELIAKHVSKDEMEQAAEAYDYGATLAAKKVLEDGTGKDHGIEDADDIASMTAFLQLVFQHPEWTAEHMADTVKQGCEGWIQTKSHAPSPGPSSTPLRRPKGTEDV